MTTLGKMKHSEKVFFPFVNHTRFRYLNHLLVLSSIFLFVCSVSLAWWHSQNQAEFNIFFNLFTTKNTTDLRDERNLTVVCDDLEVMKRQLFGYMASSINGTKYPGVINYTLYTAARLEMKPLKHAKPILPELTPIFNDITDFTYNKLEPCNIENSESSLFIAIISAPGNFEKRKSIRETWLRTLPSKLNSINLNDSYPNLNLAGVAFIIGKTNDNVTAEALAIEKSSHSDILEVGMVDAYFNLSIKVAGLLNWLNNNCDGVDYVLKVDDDVFVNVRNLGSFVRRLLSSTSLDSMKILGISGNLDVARDGKWKMTFEEYPWRNYPPFFLGPFIILSGEAIRPLAAAIQTIPYHPIDDVYLTGLCSERANVTLYWAGRLFAIFPGGRLVPCYLQRSVSWLVGGPDGMRSSHKVTEQIYNNNLPCIPHHSKLPTNPFEPLMFEIKKLGT